MTAILFDLPINPEPKGRPRFSRSGHAYTPGKTRLFEDAVKLASRIHRPKAPFKGPLRVSLTFYLTRPKTAKREWPAVRPDLDNYVKGVLDALSEFWIDDGQIVCLMAEKAYGDPKISVQIETLEES